MTPEEMSQITKTISEMLAARAPAPTTWPAAPAAGFPALVPASQMSSPQPQAVLVPISLPMPDGSTLSSYLVFGPEVLAGFPGSLQAIAAAYPVRTYQPKQQSWGNHGGGYGGGRGGYGAGGRRW